MKEHYQQPIEPVAVQEQILTQASALPVPQRHFAATAVKYLMRAGLKADQPWQQELAKAMDYCHRAVYGVWARKTVWRSRLQKGVDPYRPAYVDAYDEQGAIALFQAMDPTSRVVGCQPLDAEMARTWADPRPYHRSAPVPGVTGLWCLHHEGSLWFVEASTKEEAQAQVGEHHPRLVAVTAFGAADAQKLFESARDAHRKAVTRPWRVTWQGGSGVVDADSLGAALNALTPQGQSYAAGPVIADDVRHLEKCLTQAQAAQREQSELLARTLRDVGKALGTTMEPEEIIAAATRLPRMRPWIVADDSDIAIVDARCAASAFQAAGVNGHGYEARALRAADCQRLLPSKVQVRLGGLEQEPCWTYDRYTVDAKPWANQNMVQIKVFRCGECIANFCVAISGWQTQAESIATAVVLADMAR